MSLDTLRDRLATCETKEVMLTARERRLLIGLVIELSGVAIDWLRGLAAKYRHEDLYVRKDQLAEVLAAAEEQHALKVAEPETCPTNSLTTLEDLGSSRSPFPRLAELDSESE